MGSAEQGREGTQPGRVGVLHLLLRPDRHPQTLRAVLAPRQVLAAVGFVPRYMHARRQVVYTYCGGA